MADPDRGGPVAASDHPGPAAALVPFDLAVAPDPAGRGTGPGPLRPLPAGCRRRGTGLWLLLLLAGVAPTLVLLGELPWRLGHPVWPLDDTYIHLAVAANLAESGTWGLRSGQFASCSSSPLWTLLLACGHLLTGRAAWLPWLINLPLLLALLLLAYSWVRRQTGSATIALLAGLLLVIGGPLPHLVALGMEHLLQLLTALLLLVRWCGRWGGEAPAPMTSGGEGCAVVEASAAAGSGDDPWRPGGGEVALLALIAVAVRFEAAFLVVGLLIVTWRSARPRWEPWLAALAGAVPVLVMAGLNLAHGWPWLPLSILLKTRQTFDGRSFGAGEWLAKLPLQLLTHPLPLALSCLGVLVVLLLRSGRRLAGGGAGAAGPERRATSEVAVGAWLIALILHLQLANIGYLQRYEAWLVGLGIVVLAAALPAVLAVAGSPGWPTAWRWMVRVGLGAAAGAVVILLLARQGEAVRTLPRAASFIARQHLAQVAFCRGHPLPAGQSLGAHDVGALAYFTAVPLLDLWGLADLEVARARLAGTCSPRALADLAARRGMALAVAFPELLAAWGGVPPGWTRVATWEARSGVFWSDVFAFYVPDEVNGSSSAIWRQAFRDFGGGGQSGLVPHLD